MAVEDYLPYVHIKPDAASHVRLRDPANYEALAPLLHVCPSGVFVWDEGAGRMEVLWQRCVECGACEPACPQEVEFTFPRGGYGIKYTV